MHPLLAGVALLAQPSHVDLVASVRDALHVGGPAWSSTLLSGKARYYGEDHTFTLQFDGDNKFLQRISGPLGETYGFDGSKYWEADRSGAPRYLDFEDQDVQQAFILVQNNGWLNPPPGVTVTTQGDSVHIRLASGLEETLAIDPSTHLPTAATYTISPGQLTIKLSDWRPAGEWKIPFKTEITAGGLTDTFTADTAKEVPPGNYSLPDWTPNNVAFDAAISPDIPTKKLPSGHIIVHPLINGQDVGWFVLDSGADIMVIDPTIADNLHLPKVGELPLVGVGGVITEPFRTVGEMKLGPMTLKDTQFAELDLSMFKKAFGVEVSGIVGFDMFRRSVVKVDLTKPSVAIFDPAHFSLREGAWTSAKFSTGNIAIQAKMEGERLAWYRIDTGANGTVQFHTPYVAREHLLQDRPVVEAQEAGAGGTSEAKFGKIAWFELAGHRFESPDAVFSQATIGAFNDQYLAGNIGQEFLDPFTIYFDFGGSRVALVPKS
jgi:hypothetical protein